MLVCFFQGSQAFADDASSKVRKGNRLMERKSYGEAAALYREAMGAKPDSPEIAYNLANALYREKRWEESEKTYDQAQKKAEKKLLAHSLYNQGNALVGQGRLQEAIASYERSLEALPEDEDAKHNLEFVRQKLKEMLEQAKATQSRIEQMKSSDKHEAQESSAKEAPQTDQNEKPTQAAASKERAKGDSAEAKDQAAAVQEGASKELSQKTAGSDGSSQDKKDSKPESADAGLAKDRPEAQGDAKDLKRAGGEDGSSQDERGEKENHEAWPGETDLKKNESRKEPTAAERGLDAFERRQDQWLLPPNNTRRARPTTVAKDW